MLKDDYSLNSLQLDGATRFSTSLGRDWSTRRSRADSARSDPNERVEVEMSLFFCSPREIA